ncbi:hypothetical protein [Arenimonas metalli]|uniref:Nucleotide exchange factor GrpE n=1 Tax=Arenimonas metalli CF5-1 TaxID=1384056 RepID=A0A091ATM0_9GAMM|nr:hypothetical protein [Arenimonas metalli]KFN42706.1 hypothetical protein N787_03375 [Arenimonas metalli CF5-1]
MSDAAETNTQLEKALMEVAIESWRLSKLFIRAISKLDAGDGSKYASQLRYFQKRIEESLESGGLRLVNLEGQPFDAGMAASALNGGDFGPDDVLIVDQMVEPIVMGKDGLKKEGTVMLRKVVA